MTNTLDDVFHRQISEANKDKKLPPMVPAVLPFVGSAVKYVYSGGAMRCSHIGGKLWPSSSETS